MKNVVMEYLSQLGISNLEIKKIIDAGVEDLESLKLWITNYQELLQIPVINPRPVRSIMVSLPLNRSMKDAFIRYLKK